VAANYPVPDLLKRLQQDLGPTGSVLAWYKDFEMGRKLRHGRPSPEFAAFLEGVNTRVYEPHGAIANGWYAHPDFMGSSSIKNVLPVLVPELTYKRA